MNTDDNSVSHKIIFWLLGALLTALLAVGGFTIRGMAQTQTDHRISISRNAVSIAENRRDTYNFHEDLIRIEKKIDQLINRELIKDSRTRSMDY